MMTKNQNAVETSKFIGLWCE